MGCSNIPGYCPKSAGIGKFPSTRGRNGRRIHVPEPPSRRSASKICRVLQACLGQARYEA